VIEVERIAKGEHENVKFDKEFYRQYPDAYPDEIMFAELYNQSASTQIFTELKVQQFFQCEAYIAAVEFGCAKLEEIYSMNSD
jgi:hypothetical protein